MIRLDRAVAAAAEKDVNPPSSNVRNAKVGQHSGPRPSGGSPPSSALIRVPCATDIPISGLAALNVFASANGGRYRRIKKTTKKKIRFRAKPGRRYRFYSVAVDKAGNHEGAPASRGREDPPQEVRVS